MENHLAWRGRARAVDTYVVTTPTLFPTSTRHTPSNTKPKRRQRILPTKRPKDLIRRGTHPACRTYKTRLPFRDNKINNNSNNNNDDASSGRGGTGHDMMGRSTVSSLHRSLNKSSSSSGRPATHAGQHDCSERTANTAT